VTVVSPAGKEATLSFLGAGDFIGEESIAGAMGRHLATATAITPCIALKIDRAEMIRVLHEEHVFSDLFLTFLLPAACVPRLTWSTSFLTLAKGVWQEFFC
jgi:CRP/FNR family cyclic AMP-dependent transcriptional regulator